MSKKKGGPPPKNSKKQNYQPESDENETEELSEEKQAKWNYPELKNKPILEWSLVDNDLKLSQVESKFKTENPYANFDFTGLECATDFMVYLASKALKSHPKKNDIEFDSILINGCKNVTIWSLHYLNQAKDNTLFDLKNSKFAVKAYNF